MKKDILIVGNAHDKHLERFIKGLKGKSFQYSVDIFDISMRYADIPNASLYDNTYTITRHFPKLLYKICGIAKIIKYFDLLRSFKKIGNSYSIINIQVVTIQSYLLLKLYKQYSKYLITTPWGSDVYRIGKSLKRKYQHVYDASNFVCVMPNTKFGDDIIEQFNVPKDKCLELCFGSDVLDKVMADDTSKDDSKQNLFGTKENYVITCGYNASPAQNHILIIDALNKVKLQLPKNTLLVFPLTYARKAEYLSE